MSLANLLEKLRSQDVTVKSLTDGVDTSTSMGRMLFGLLASLAEFERETIKERVNAGMAAARKAGIHLGRPPSLNRVQTEEARRMMGEGKPARQVAALLKTSERSLFRALVRHPV
jgi:DNA invertase Pin-like site-specific DNA recombinase